MFKNKFNGLEKNHVTNKTFDYKKKKVHLNFTLNIKDKEMLSDFLELLNEAVSEVEKEINGN